MTVASLLKYLQKNSLGRRVLAAILLCSTCLAFLATGVQLLLDYKHNVSAIEVKMDEIERSHLNSLASSMWFMEDVQTRAQLDGIANLRGVSYVQLLDTTGKLLLDVGKPETSRTLAREMLIKHNLKKDGKESVVLGTLIVTVSLEEIYQDLANKALVILMTQTIKTTLVALFTIFIFHHLVSRHLSTLASYVSKLDINNISSVLALSRKPRKLPDELDVVVSAFNEMAGSVKRDFDELQELRTGLEKLVEIRTTELAHKVVEMEKEMREHELAERTVRENEERYRQVVEMSPDGILIESHGRIVFCNSATLTLLGASSLSEIIGQTMEDFVHLEWRQIARDHMKQLLENAKELCSFEAKLTRVDGSNIDVEINRSIFQYKGAPAIQTVAHNIAKHKHYEEQLRRQALHDALTGLPNRALLLDRLESAITLAARQKYSIYVLFFDLDRFKYINDTLGHDAGDELLIIITARMSECIRQCDTLARLGGDEFVLLLGQVVDEDAILSLVQRIMNRICEPMQLGKREVSITCSIGMSAYPQDSGNAMDLLKFADIAMYQAKGRGRNGMQRYQADMQRNANEHLSMESSLRRALEREELLLYFQSMLDLHSGKIIGAEALIRWQHPEFGLIAPSRFIPLAEETGMIVEIGKWVLRCACKQTKAWHDLGFGSLRICVNLSAHQLQRIELEDEVRDALSDAGLEPQYLELEITESSSMDDPEKTVFLLHKFKAMGVHVAIDDFGTGYSNLSYLKRFPVTRLKLDRSFVCDIKRGVEDSQIAKAIINLAHGLNLIVVAEGVEDSGQLEQLVAYGCDEMQGYYFSQPLPIDAFVQLLQSGRSLDLPVS